jgi:acyl carrier protein
VAEGLDLLGNLLAGDYTQLAAIDIDWRQLFQNDPPAARLPMFSDIAEQYAPAPATHAAVETELLRSLRPLAASEQRRQLMDYLSRQIARTLKLDAGFTLEPRQQLFDLGFDSILAIELKNHLERSFGRPFSATLLFMHPTLESLTGYLLDEAFGLAGNGAAGSNAERGDGLPNELPNMDAISEEQMLDLLLREIEAGRP